MVIMEKVNAWSWWIDFEKKELTAEITTHVALIITETFFSIIMHCVRTLCWTDCVAFETIVLCLKDYDFFGCYGNRNISILLIRALSVHWKNAVINQNKYVENRYKLPNDRFVD